MYIIIDDKEIKCKTRQDVIDYVNTFDYAFCFRRIRKAKTFQTAVKILSEYDIYVFKDGVKIK